MKNLCIKNGEKEQIKISSVTNNYTYLKDRLIIIRIPGSFDQNQIRQYLQQCGGSNISVNFDRKNPMFLTVYVSFSSAQNTQQMKAYFETNGIFGQGAKVMYARAKQQSPMPAQQQFQGFNPMAPSFGNQAQLPCAMSVQSQPQQLPNPPLLNLQIPQMPNNMSQPTLVQPSQGKTSQETFVSVSPFQQNVSFSPLVKQENVSVQPAQPVTVVIKKYFCCGINATYENSLNFFKQFKGFMNILKYRENKFLINICNEEGIQSLTKFCRENNIVCVEVNDNTIFNLFSTQYPSQEIPNSN